MPNLLARFLAGEVTWAQVEGMTAEHAARIAQTACDLAAAGKLEEARVLLEGLVAGNPHDASARAALGTVFQKLGRIPEALAEYEAVIAAGAQSPVALANRGELRLAAGDPRGATDLEAAVAVDPQGTTVAAQRAAGLLRAIATASARREK